MTRILVLLLIVGGPAALLALHGLGTLGLVLLAGGACLALAGMWIAHEVGRTADEISRHGE